MPWRCPACNVPIHHSDTEIAPRPGAHYRCHVCRLELVFDPKANKFTVPPFDEAPDRPPKRKRTSR